MRRVWEVAEPYPEVQKGIIPEDAFAAELAPVISGKAPSVYQNPDEFFSKTYLTRNLEGLIRAVLGRVSGRKEGEPAVLRIETVFGGGKSHALLALYHIFNSPSTTKKYVEHILRSIGLTSIPRVRMAVIVGATINPVSGTQHDNITAWTLWGELAYQLGGKELYLKFKENDEKKIPPGTEKLAELFESPSVILIDEISEYLSKSSGIKVGDTTLAEQTVAFIHELALAVAATDSSVLVITALTEADPYRKYTREVIEAIEDIKKVTGRVATIFTPVEPEEIYDVVRIRLFKKIDEKARDDVVREFVAYYHAMAGQFPSKTVEAGYAEKLSKSYPIHPELIDILYERVSTIPEFQRTRGVLRFLAYVVFKVYESRPNDAYMIMPAFVDLTFQKIIDDLTLKLGRSLYQPVIVSDIANKKGNAKAQMLDVELSSAGIKNNLATRLATSIYLYSLIGAVREDIGGNQQQLLLSLAYPGFNIRQVPEVLKRLMDELWYIYESAGRYSFRTEPNINKIIEEVKESVKDEDIRNEIEALIRDRIGFTFFSKDKVYIWPHDHYEVPDGPEPKLIIVDYNIAKAKSPKDFMEETLPSHLFHVTQIYNKSGEQFRQYKNTVFFLVADDTNIDRLKDKARFKIAVSTVRNNKEIVEKLTKDQKTLLESKYGEAVSNFEISLLQAYRYVVCPAPRGRLNCFTLSIEERMKGEKKLTKLVYEKLMTEGKIITEKISPDLIVEKCWIPMDKTFITTQEVYDSFLRYTDLPLVQDKDIVVNAIKSGVKAEKFGYTSIPIDLLEQKLEGPFWFGDICEGSNADNVEISPSTYLISSELAKKIADAIQKKRAKAPEEKRKEVKAEVQLVIPFLKGEEASSKIAEETRKFVSKGMRDINSLVLHLKGGTNSVIAASTLAAMISALTGIPVILKSASFEGKGDTINKIEIKVEGLQEAIQVLKSLIETIKAELKTVTGEIIIEVNPEKPIDVKILEDLSRTIKGYRDIEFGLTCNGATGGS